MTTNAQISISAKKFKNDKSIPSLIILANEKNLYALHQPDFERVESCCRTRIDPELSPSPETSTSLILPDSAREIRKRMRQSVHKYVLQ